jgi:serine/threonine protein kinase/lipopolysaccharide biosynthesis regulator YciM
MTEESIFHAALERSNPADRARFLDQACGSDAELRRRVDALLIAHEGSAELLEGLDPVDLFASAPSPASSPGSTQTSTSTDPATAAFIPQSQPPNASSGAATERETRSEWPEGSTPTVAATADYRGSAGDRRDGDSIKILEGPGSRIGSYKLLQNIGEGGMGVVFMAEQEKPVRRKVALKIIKPGMDTNQVVARFEAERQALAMMDHQNIARVFDAGATETGRPYFVMELVCGKPITEFCDGRQMSPRERLELFIQVCKAIQHAHQKGIIHRDIKPSNVLVTIQDGKPVPKVIDFGVAKATDQSLTEKTLFTQHGALVGTLEYMSPEQAEAGGIDIDTRSDIYSLGVLLYELLTGSTPIEKVRLRRAAYGEVLRRIREEEPPKPSTRLSESGESLPSIASVRQTEPSKLTKLMRGEIDWIVMKSLEKDRKRRYETANAFARDIERYLHDEAVEAGPPSTSYKLRKFARKHRAALATASAFALVLIAATLISVVSAILTSRAERRSRIDRDRALVAEAKAKADRDVAAAARDGESKARKSAEKSEKEARAQLKKFELMNTFLTNDLLTQVEPENNNVESKVTLFEVLNRAAEKVGDRYKSDPELEIALRKVIARTYHSLGYYDKAESQWRAIHDRAASTPGVDRKELWISQSERGHMERHLGRYKEAIELCRDGLDGIERLLGPDHPETLRCSNNLALVYMSAGRTAEAIALHESTLKLSEAKLGPDHPDTMHFLINLAGTYRTAGRIDDAIALQEKILKIQEAKLGLDHPDTLTCRENLACSYFDAGRIAKAVSLFETSFKQIEAKLGIDHPNTLSNRNNLATAYQAAGRTAEAVSLLETTLKQTEAKLGPDHPDTLTSRNNLASAYQASGRTAEAIALLEPILKRSEAKLGIDHPITLASCNNLASAYQRAGRIDEAIALLEKTVKRIEDNLGIDHPNTLVIRNNLAFAYQHAGRIDEAIALHEKTLKQQEAKLGIDHLDTLTTRNNLAFAYQVAGRIDESIPLFETTLKQSEAKFGLDHPDTLLFCNNLASIYESEKHWEKAEPLRRKILDHYRRKGPAESPAVANALASLGKNLLFQGKPAEAEPFLRECLAIREKKLADDWLRFNAMSLLGGALSGQKKYAEAEPLLIQGYEGMKAREFKIHRQAKINIPDAAERIVSLYEAWGEPEKAAEWREKIKAAPPTKPDSNPKPAPK